MRVFGARPPAAHTASPTPGQVMHQRRRAADGETTRSSYPMHLQRGGPGGCHPIQRRTPQDITEARPPPLGGHSPVSTADAIPPPRPLILVFVQVAGIDPALRRSAFAGGLTRFRGCKRPRPMFYSPWKGVALDPIGTPPRFVPTVSHPYSPAAGPPAPQSAEAAAYPRAATPTPVTVAPLHRFPDVSGRRAAETSRPPRPPTPRQIPLPAGAVPSGGPLNRPARQQTTVVAGVRRPLDQLGELGRSKRLQSVHLRHRRPGNGGRHIDICAFVDAVPLRINHQPMRTPGRPGAFNSPHSLQPPQSLPSRPPGTAHPLRYLRLGNPPPQAAQCSHDRKRPQVSRVAELRHRPGADHLPPAPAAGADVSRIGGETADRRQR